MEDLVGQLPAQYITAPPAVQVCVVCCDIVVVVYSIHSALLQGFSMLMCNCCLHIAPSTLFILTLVYTYLVHVCVCVLDLLLK
jgi:hypothetical protein